MVDLDKNQDTANLLAGAIGEKGDGQLPPDPSPDDKLETQIKPDDTVIPKNDDTEPPTDTKTDESTKVDDVTPPKGVKPDESKSKESTAALRLRVAELEEKADKSDDERGELEHKAEQWDHLDRVWHENPGKFEDALARRLGESNVTEDDLEFDPDWRDLSNEEYAEKMKGRDKKLLVLARRNPERESEAVERDLEAKYSFYKHPEMKNVVNQVLNKLETGELKIIDLVMDSAALGNAAVLIELGEEAALEKLQRKLALESPRGGHPNEEPKPTGAPDDSLTDEQRRDKQFEDELHSIIR